MLENLIYGLAILFLLAQLLIARKKEFGLLVISHAVLQYVYTLLSWRLQLAPGVALATLGFIVATTMLLIWARRMHIGSNDQKMAQTLVNALQWTFLGALLFFVIIRSPDWYEFSGSNENGAIIGSYVSLHPFIRMSGNYFLFALFAQITIRWGLVWKPRDTLLNLGPFVGYVLLILLLLARQASFNHHPYT